LKINGINDPHLSHSPNTLGDLNHVFPNKVCINLDRRSDRWEQMRAQFERHDVRAVRRFAALDGKTLTIPSSWSATAGAYGCLLSHLQVVREARDQGQPNVLIFEDDVVFDAHLRDKFRAYFSQLPLQWDMLYFGAMHLDDLRQLSDNVHQLRRAFSTYAYALNHTIFEAFIEVNSKADMPVDHNNHALQTQYACYCFVPHLAWVESTYSDVQERHKHPWYIQESLVIHGSNMDRLLGHSSLIIAYTNPRKDETIAQNLVFLTRFYTEKLPRVSIIIIEQGVDATLDSVPLPGGCHYSLVRDSGPLNSGLCFNVGIQTSNPQHRFLILSDSDIFVEEWDIRGNLRKCEEYDCTTGYRRLIELTAADSLKLRNNGAMLTPWFNVEAYSPCQKSVLSSRFGVFNRQSLIDIGWQEQRPKESGLSLEVNSSPRLRVFDSPNDALRLHHD
jgi:GR25 family glycosyltransferase involved in LPS biosynthesis